MQGDGEERDFLVRAQPEHDPLSFVELVKEAFLLEHDCIQRQDIAEVLGVDKSRITQIFGDPKRLKAQTIRNLLDHLKSREHKKRIVRAWMLECFGEDVLSRNWGSVTGNTITEKTVRRIDRQIRESRLATASQLAVEAFAKTDDPVMKERLLDRAFFARQRLDNPGQAMAIARAVAQGAARRGEIGRLAGGYLFRARILEGMADSTPAELQPIYEEIHQMLEGLEPERERLPYFVADLAALDVARFRSYLTFVERGLVAPDELLLRRRLKVTLGRIKPPSSYQRRFQHSIVAARIHLILGETFQAQEVLEKGFASGEIKNLQAYENCSLMQARIMLRTESPEKTREYLRTVSGNCAASQDRYHQRIAEYDLARLESSMFVSTKSDG